MLGAPDRPHSIALRLVVDLEWYHVYIIMVWPSFHLSSTAGATEV